MYYVSLFIISNTCAFSTMKNYWKYVQGKGTVNFDLLTSKEKKQLVPIILKF